MAENFADQLYALVDMGSNGIRFSISSLAPPTTRALPTVYQNRLGVSLYDVQYEHGRKVPIPRDTIDTILSALRRFKQTSLDFGVPQRRENVRILATEATRNATNSAEFIRGIEEVLGEPWKVDVLRKEDEGRIGALGVVSSVGGSEGLEGLMMDLGGGSTQLTWLVAHPPLDLETSPVGSISFPYGAAAMTRLLSETTDDSSRMALKSKMVSEFQDAYKQLSLPARLQRKAKSSGLTLYLSGGGFRGWGYLLMSSHRIRPYPIPIINGFTVPAKDFKNTTHISDLAASSLFDMTFDGIGVFRVSKRRAAQVPAVSFLIDSLVEAIPAIIEVRFCQGGVREGWLFDQLPADVRHQDPMVAASGHFATDLESANHFANLLTAALPSDCPILDRHVPCALKDQLLLKSFANLMFLQQGHSKESAALNALHIPITGALASSHGLGHRERALLSLMLCQRWGGDHDLPAPHGELKRRLELLLTNQEIWWARYLAAIGSCISEIYPAGRLSTGIERVGFEAKWSEGLGKKGNLQGAILKIVAKNTSQGENMAVVSAGDVADIAEEIEKMGKKKNRIGGREYGFGVPVRVDVTGLL